MEHVKEILDPVKNKKLTYILLPIVIGVWGLIIYRIFAVASPDSPTPRFADSQAEAASSQLPDTFHLLANYPDPFLGRIVQEKRFSSGKPVLKKEGPKPVVKAQQAWPAITYVGMIKNQKSSKQLVMVQIDGVSNVMKAGDNAGGIALTRIFRDSVELAMGKDRKIVKK